MAARDVKLYLSLKKALIDKVANPSLTSHTLEVGGESRTYDYDYIFQTARRVFPQKYNLSHSYLNQIPISNLNSEQLKELNMEYAESIVKGWGGIDQSQIKEKELDAQLIEYEDELTAPDEPDYLYKEMEGKALTNDQANAQDEPSPANETPADNTPQSSGLSSQKPATLARGPLTNKERFGSKETYATYKEENKEARAERAKKLWENRKKASFSKEQYGSYKNDNQEERKKRAADLWKRRQAGLLRPSTAKAWNPLGDWATKKIAEKIAQSKIGQAVARNLIDPIKQAIQNTRAWQAVAPRLQPLADFYNRIASPFRTVGHWLGAPERWINNNLLSPLQNWAGSAARNILNSGFNLARSGISNFFNALRGYGGQAAAGASSVGAGLYYAGTTLAAIVTTATFWWVVAIVGFFIFTWWYNNQLSNSQCDKPGQMEVLKRLANPRSGEDNVGNGDQIDYLIQVTYIWLCDQKTLPTVTVVDDIPPELEYVEGSAQSESASQGVGPNGEYNPVTRQVKWELTNVISNDPIGIYFSVKPIQQDDGSWSVQDNWLLNQATVTYLEPNNIPALPPGENQPPNQDTCNGKYKLNNPLGNYGDPSCNFTEDLLFEQLQQLDPANAKYWFDVVVKCESSYNPNAYADHSVVGTPDPVGGWGLFQMGRGKNGQYDHGDVIWQNQTSNAITYNNNLARKWRYWACARSRW